MTNSFEMIRSAIADQLSIEKDSITLSSRLLEDLKADSLDVMELIMAIEEELNTEIPDEILQNIRTVGDIVEHLDKL